MKRLSSLFLTLLTLVGWSSRAWATDLTKVAKMTDFVQNAGVKTATELTTTSNVDGGAVYDCSTGYLGACYVSAVATAYEGDKIVTVAMWVYGRPGGTCLFGYGDQGTGIMMKLAGTSMGLTTKNKSDILKDKNASEKVLENQWNLVAYSFPGATATDRDARIYAGTDDNNFFFSGTNVAAMNAPAPASKKCAIGSGNQGGERDNSTGIIANVTVFTSDALPTNQEIATAMGDAPVLPTGLQYDINYLFALKNRIGVPADMSSIAQYANNGVTEENESAAAAAYNALITNNKNLYLPTGYYYFRSIATDRSQPYLYNNYFLENNTQHHTVQSNTKPTRNTGIWKVTNNGTSISIVNADGKPLVQGNQNQGNTGGVTSRSTLNFGNFNLSKFKEWGNKGIYFTEGLNASNTNTYSVNNSQETRFVTTWAGQSNARDDNWTFELMANEANIYHVVINNAPNDECCVRIVGSDDYAFTGGFFYAESLAKSQLTATDVENQATDISITDHTIKVTYTSITPTEYARNKKLADAASKQSLFGTSLGQVQGKNGSTIYNSYDSYCAAINAAETIDAVNAFSTEYIMPEEGTQYFIRQNPSGNYRNWYITANESSLTAKQTPSNNAIFTFTDVDKSNATLKIKAFNDNYVQAYQSDNTQIQTGATPVSYTLTYISDGIFVLGATDSNSDHRFLHYNSNDKVVGWTSSSTPSQWYLEEPQTCTYGVFSAGMPEGAVVTINGKEFTSLNAQAGNNVECLRGGMDESLVSVSVGRGYGYLVSVDNSNTQVSVDFYSLFVPAEVANVNNITEAEKEAAAKYYIKDRINCYPKIADPNIGNTETKSQADKFIFIQNADNRDTYYIYDVTAGQYIYYTQTTGTASTTTTSSSAVQYTTDLSGKTATWKIVMENTQKTVDIIPATGNAEAWNYKGGKTNVLNLYSKGDTNASWTIIDSNVGSLACATLVYAKTGAEFMHKIVPEESLTVSSADFTNISAAGGHFELKDRSGVGNNYKYVTGTAPTTEGEYTYTINLSDGSHATVKLIVDNFMQSPTPMMGWLTWNWFARAIGHQQMVDIAQGLQDKGLAAVGFKTIVLDDCWATNQSVKENLAYDPVKFPSGIAGLKTAIRQINPEFKLGIYSDAGSMTCENYQPGSYGVEELHVNLFDQYGVDMLKYDRCREQGTVFGAYSQMGEAIKKLNDKRRNISGAVPFIYNACEWGHNDPWTWGAEAGASSWRATDDVREVWNGYKERPGVLYASDQTRTRWMYANVNRFNDLDMMCIGLHGLGGPSNNTGTHGNNGKLDNPLTDAQARSQMSIWCMFASPLSLTADVRRTPAAAVNTTAGTLPDPLITREDLATLTNTEIISINQDALGQQAEWMPALSNDDAIGTNNNGAYTVYVKDLVGGEMALAVVNRGGAEIPAGTITNITPASIYMDGQNTVYYKNVWTAACGEIAAGENIAIPALAPYETCVLKLRSTETYEEPEADYATVAAQHAVPELGKVYVMYNDHLGTGYAVVNNAAALVEDGSDALDLESDASYVFLYPTGTEGEYKIKNLSTGNNLSVKGAKQDFKFDSSYHTNGVTMFYLSNNCPASVCNSKTAWDQYTAKNASETPTLHYNENGLYSTDFVFMPRASYHVYYINKTGYTGEGAGVTVNDAVKSDYVISAEKITSFTAAPVAGYTATATLAADGYTVNVEYTPTFTLTPITDLSHLDNSKVYVVNTKRGSLEGKDGEHQLYQTKSADGTTVTDANFRDYNPESEYQQWAILQSSHGNYYMVNRGTGEFIVTPISGKITTAEAPNATTLHFTQNDATAANVQNYPWLISLAETGSYFSTTDWSGEGWKGFISRDGKGDLGNQWQILEVDGALADNTAYMATIEAFEAKMWSEAVAGAAVFNKYDAIAGSYFGPSYSKVDTYKAAISAAVSEYDNTKSWADNVASATLNQEAVDAATTAVESGWNTAFPANGGRFIIKNRDASRGYYLTDNGTAFGSSATCATNNQVWEFVRIGETSTYQLRNRATGRFLKLNGQSEAASAVESVNRDEAGALMITPGTAETEGTSVSVGYVAISKSGSTITQNNSSLHFGSGGSVLTWGAGSGSQASHWLIYEVLSDYPVAGEEYLIRNNYNGNYATYAGVSTAMIAVSKANISEGSVWTFTDNANGSHKLQSQGNKEVYYAAIKSFTAEGADVYFNASPVNSTAYAIGSNAENSEHNFWHNNGGNVFINWAANAGASVMAFDLFDRVIDDARYELNKMISPYASSKHATDAFFFNEEKFNTYHSYITDAYTLATAWTVYSHLQTKLAKGILDTDFNIPESGIYMLQVKNSGDYITSGSDSFKGSDEITRNSFFDVVFTTTGDKVTAQIKHVVSDKYMKAVESQKWTTTDEPTPVEFELTPAPMGNNGYTAIGNPGVTVLTNGSWLHQNVHYNKIQSYFFVSGNQDKQSIKFISVPEIVNELYAQADAMIERGCDELFEVSTSSAAAITAAKGVLNAAMTADPQVMDAVLTGIDELYALLHSPTIYNLPHTDRYFFKNKASGRFLTNYNSDQGPLVNVTNPSYYSVFDVVRTSDAADWDGSYYIINEGAAFIKDPQVANVDGYRQAGHPYMIYNSETPTKFRFKMAGTCTQDANDKWSWTPDAVPAGQEEAYKVWLVPAGEAGYCWISGDPHASRDNFSKVGGISWGDGTFKYAEGQNGGGFDKYSWSSFMVVKFAESEEAAASAGATNLYEPTLVQNHGYNNKLGYAGGVLTMDGYENVEALKQFKEFFEARKTTIAENGSEYEHVADNLHAFAELNNYYINVLPKSYQMTLNTTRKFYLENLDRPTALGRMADVGQTITKGGTTLDVPVSRSKKNLSDEDDRSKWGLTEAITRNGNGHGYYFHNEATGRYLKYKANPASSSEVTLTDNEDEAMVVDIYEVVPGIYLIQDQDAIATGHARNLTVTDGANAGGTLEEEGTSPNANCWNIHYYNNPELSTYWKIMTIEKLEAPAKAIPNTYAAEDKEGRPTVVENPFWSEFYQISGEGEEQVITTKDGTPVAAGQNADVWVATFSHELPSRIKAEEKVIPYYVTSAANSDGTLRVTMVKAPSYNETDGTVNYYLKGGQGYILVKPTTNGTDEQSWVDECLEYVTAYKTDQDVEIEKVNMLTAALSPVIVTNDNWERTFVLSYQKENVKIGTLQGSNVYGRGLGFYHLKTGGRVKSNKAYLNSSVFTQFRWDLSQGKWVDASSENNVRAEERHALTQAEQEAMEAQHILLQIADENGNVTGIIKPNANGTGSMMMFDLSGRRVSTAQPGTITIKDGKKYLNK